MQYVKIKDATATIAVNGSFELCVLPFVQDELLSASNAGCIKIVVDFAATTVIDSAGLSFLLDLKQQAGEGNITAINLPMPIYKIFKTNNLLQQFEIKNREI